MYSAAASKLLNPVDVTGNQYKKKQQTKQKNTRIFASRYPLDIDSYNVTRLK